MNNALWALRRVRDRYEQGEHDLLRLVATVAGDPFSHALPALGCLKNAASQQNVAWEKVKIRHPKITPTVGLALIDAAIALAEKAEVTP